MSRDCLIEPPNYALVSSVLSLQTGEVQVFDAMQLVRHSVQPILQLLHEPMGVIHLSLLSSLFMSVYVCVCMSVCLSVCLCVCVPVALSDCHPSPQLTSCCCFFQL